MKRLETEQKAIKEYVNSLLDDETKRLVHLAAWDLYWGPVACSPEAHNGPDDGKPWPGFSAACERIKEALDGLDDLWVEGDNVMTREPEGYTDNDTGEWVEPYLEETYRFPRREVLRVAFSALAEHLY
jgi:hypothetical protein